MLPSRGARRQDDDGLRPGAPGPRHAVARATMRAAPRAVIPARSSCKRLLGRHFDDDTPRSRYFDASRKPPAFGQQRS